MNKIAEGLAILLFLAFPMLAWAADYYVATDGNNSDPGTEAQPWLTIDHAMSTVTSGDTVYVKTGTYAERVDIDNSGSSGAYITLAAAAGNTPTIDGTGNGTGRMIRIAGKSYIIVDGISISGTAVSNSIRVDGPGSNIIIRNCTIYDHAGTSCVYFGGGSGITDITVDGCTLHDIDTGSLESIRIMDDCSNFKILNNVIYNHSNIGIDCVSRTYNQDDLPRYGLIEGNLVYNSTDDHGDGSAGIYLDGASHVCIQGNTVLGCVNGISIGTEYNGSTSTANIMRRNYIYSNHVDGSFYGGTTSGGHVKQSSVYHNVYYGNTTDAWSSELMVNKMLGGNMFQNNIVYSLNTTQRRKIRMNLGIMGNSLTADYNCYYIDTGSNVFLQDGVYYQSLSAWQTEVAPEEANSISDDPLFVNGDGRDFRLQSGSPCIDAGGPLAEATDGGTGTAISVDNAAPFVDGYNGLFSGDVIRVGLNSAVTITAVDIEANTLTVHTSISWIVGDPVHLDYSGSGPDIGALEYGDATATPTSTPIPTSTPGQSSRRRAVPILGGEWFSIKLFARVQGDAAATLTPTPSPTNSPTATPTSIPTYAITKSYLFDGTNDWVTFTNTNIPTGDASRSVSLWFKATAGSAKHVMVGWGEQSSNAWFSWIYTLNSFLRTQVWSYGTDELGSTVLTNNTWYHAVVTYDSGTGAIKSYINKSIDINDTVTDYATSVGGSFKFGARVANDYRFAGYLADVKIYNRAITQSEVNNLYDKIIVDSGLVFWGKCAEGSGTVCEDEYNNDGTITTDDAGTFHSTEVP